MRTKATLSIIFLTFFTTLSGCTTIEGVKQTKGEGTTKTFREDYDLVWDASLRSINSLGLNLEDADRNKFSGVLLASSARQGMSLGENVVVFVTANEPSETSVEVVTQPVLGTKTDATDWDVPFLSQVSASLERMRSTPNVVKKDKVYLVRSDYDELPKKIQERLSDRYDIEFYSDAGIGLITERQVQDVSTAGSTTGSDVGSALASAVYLNNTLSSGNYNVWTDIGVTVLGGIAGSGANKKPESRFLLKYTIRNREGNLRSTTVYRSSPLGKPIGTCFSFKSNSSVNEEYCRGMSRKEIEDKYLSD